MHMAPGNLHGLPDLDHCKYLINTIEEDVEYLLAAPQIRALKEMLPVEVREVPIKAGDKYHALGELQSMVLRDAVSDQFDAVFPLYADVLCAAGTFANSAKRLEEGHLAVVSLGPQTITKPISQELLRPGRYASGLYALDVPPRELVELTFRYLHPFHAPSFWAEGQFTTTPSMIFWDVPGQGVLVHGFHLHPVALAVQDSPLFTSPFYGSLDEHFMPRLFDSADRIYIGKDSDEIYMCSMENLQGGDARAASTSGEPTIAKVARWAERHSYMLHRDFIKFPIRLHTRDIELDSWTAAEAEAQQIISRTLQRLSTPSDILELEDYAAFDGRRYHIEVLNLIYDIAVTQTPYSRLFLHTMVRAAIYCLLKYQRFVNAFERLLKWAFISTPQLIIKLAIHLLFRIFRLTLHSIYRLTVRWAPRPITAHVVALQGRVRAAETKLRQRIRSAAAKLVGAFRAAFFSHSPATRDGGRRGLLRRLRAFIMKYYNDPELLRLSPHVLSKLLIKRTLAPLFPYIKAEQN